MKMEVQEITFIILSSPSQGFKLLCDDDDGHTKNIVVRDFKICCGCMGWPGCVRFPGLKFCPSPPLYTGL